MNTAAVLTLSTSASKGEREDTAGNLLIELLKKENFKIESYDILPDDKEKIKRAHQETIRAKKYLKNFKDIDILLCHQPPYKILDKTGGMAPKHWHGKHAGSKVILDYINKKHPNLVLCGHMHESAGKDKIGKTEVINLGSAGGYAVFDFKF